MLGPHSAPPRTPSPDELEALIEEARERARRRRRRYLRLTLLATAAAAAVLFALVRADDDSPRATGDPSGLGFARLQSGVIDGRVTFTLRVEENSGQQTLEFDGPFVASLGELPAFDLSLSLSGGDEPPARFSLIATADAGYLVVDGQAYSVSPERFDSIRSNDPFAGVELDQWWANGAAGSSTASLSKLDVGAMASDLGEAATALGLDASSFSLPTRSLTAQQIRLRAEDPRAQALELAVGWRGTSDDMGRFEVRVDATLAVSELGEPQQVAAPADDARPIDGVPLRRFPSQLWGLVEFLQRDA